MKPENYKDFCYNGKSQKEENMDIRAYQTWVSDFLKKEIGTSIMPLFAAIF